MPRHPLRRTLAGLGLTIAAVGSMSACAELDDIGTEILDPSTAADAPAVVDAEADYYTITGDAEIEHKPAPGEVAYEPLDSLDRPTGVAASLTGRDGAEREDITFDPPGWENNTEVDIPALDDVEGSKDYHGWFYNRSHMLADSLGGNAVPENMVTGTRTQNVGSTQVEGQSAGGMAHTELIARDYIDSGKAADCPLYYAAEPDYTGNELVPRTVTVDIRSCDGAIDERVEVANTANGFDIDYATGDWAPSAG